MDHKFKSKWENNNFIFEKDYRYDGTSWRQRSFVCNFCKKEFNSAQALGGHMNVHRRDRARLRQSSPSTDPPNPNPNPNFSSPPSSLMCLPFNTFHPSLFSLDISAPSLSVNTEEKVQKMPPNAPQVAWNFLDQETETRVWKKKENFKKMGLLKDEKIEMGLDLELRLGRS
ncbi:hypothetical protein SSX86_022209 [Deinandra increscens subsp. villosa]|uniref:C2H2-type domain-containing protein n=1 Tax=Deinandra increscens subsp. villosa TaxID=3103831 RepID=A0AAP0CQ88_9ASTR